MEARPLPGQPRVLLEPGRRDPGRDIAAEFPQCGDIETHVRRRERREVSGPQREEADGGVESASVGGMLRAGVLFLEVNKRSRDLDEAFEKREVRAGFAEPEMFQDVMCLVVLLGVETLKVSQIAFVERTIGDFEVTKKCFDSVGFLHAARHEVNTFSALGLPSNATGRRSKVTKILVCPITPVMLRPVQFLLSLPPAMAGYFSEWSGRPPGDWFASCDPAGRKLGSGGGVVQMLLDAWQAEGSEEPFAHWLRGRKRLVMLAGGQSRRLPAYAATGKVLMPVPVINGSHGQRLDQTLLDLQVADYRAVLENSPDSACVLVASGDVFLRFPENLPPVPEADIVGFGMSVSPEIARDFGVFFSPRDQPNAVSFFLQKPEPGWIRELARDQEYLVDTGLWLLSARAVEVLMEKSGVEGSGVTTSYELYSGMGPSLGTEPMEPDRSISALTSAVVPLRAAEFHHFGTTRQMIESLSALQRRTGGGPERADLWRKPHPDMYVLNSDFTFRKRLPSHEMIWIENCALPADFLPTAENSLTGVPPGEWDFDLPRGICLDFVPIGEADFAVRPYGFDDPFSGPVSEAAWMGRRASEWFAARGISWGDAGFSGETDLQEAPIFCVTTDVSSEWISWLIAASPAVRTDLSERWLESRRLSAAELARDVNLARLFGQRQRLAARAAVSLWEHRETNPFFRVDLENAAALYAESGAAVPGASSSRAMDHMHEAAFAAAVVRKRGGDGGAFEREAFRALADRIVSMSAARTVVPRSTLIDDQILWARSPVRLDLAGGWSDTPPFCLKHGGAVVNLAVELNGQAPVQVFARMSRKRRIVIRSIDLGAETVIQTLADLEGVSEIGGEFALAKAAVCLAGFHPRFRNDGATTLEEILEAFGGGVEVSMLAATPKGSGLGTSSVLAATLLAALGSSGGFGWDNEEIFQRTLALEQMLTSGGGWQDQAGGIYHGIKLIETLPGLEQNPTIKWLPEHLLGPQQANTVALLFYTGITRVAQTILREIVRGMFLNNGRHLANLFAIRAHALEAYQAIQLESWEGLCRVVQRSWELNEALDSGTNPPEVAAILNQISDWTAGAKLLGAGGGGYLLILAKDLDSAAKIRRSLQERPPNPRARFVDFSLSTTGLQITRS